MCSLNLIVSAEDNVWLEILALLEAELEPEEFRRWFSASSYASDSGDQITVWVPSVNDGRQIDLNYSDRLQRVLSVIGRANTHVRFVATGYSEDDDDDDE